MDMGTFRGITALLILIAFLGIVAWAYSRRRKKDFDEAANLPFADDDEMPNRDQASRNEADSRHDRGDKNR
ncbi:cbb3-type cytochrome c oxidase subunit 3 [Halomonas pacifica]|uniref:Cbb3-type cytochrome c oxidase subunit 3 n=1 Tax=Bisbaumannia pacifica TaxID=77098 RepID=A0A510XBY1_9GAMM|nr:MULTISPECIES: cbb3-type cytochrome c oxidase subunit 3 [Halomonas]MBH8581793.1 cbb3-type cytochrome c oxidase subunit 3 [Halomonas pacifica]MDC8803064.1 cbb3-type cytochrome c oxidase subunit 3 [Halomonas pacifica]GEK48883.1 cytochrome C oxidase cbb3-type subunit CcoQ [Halomonas pacifica]GKW50110.1 cytochrome C oxidase cbb3-type subunit CcoQ [Halomonas sp. NCCP-2165]